MPRPRKRLAEAAGPDQRLSEKCTRTENSAEVGNCSPQKAPPSTDREKTPHSHWLMKSEPESRLEKGVDVKFGIEDLKAQPKQTACWDGVRNYQARNFLRSMKLEEEAFFYHSNCKQPGIAGLMKEVYLPYDDIFQVVSEEQKVKRGRCWCSGRLHSVSVESTPPRPCTLQLSPSTPCHDEMSESPLHQS